MKLTKFFALICVVLGFVACGNDSGITPVGDITLLPSKTAVAIGEVVTFKVADANGQDVTSLATIYTDSFVVVEKAQFKAEQSGTYSFFATVNDKTSPYVDVNVLAEMPTVPADPDATNTKFNHRVVLIDHTGINCPACPYAMDLLAEINAHAILGKHVNEVTCHAGGYAPAGIDPAYSPAASNLNKFHTQKISGYPCVVVNLYGVNLWDKAVTDVGEAIYSAVKKDGADVGISMAVDGDTNTILCAAEIKSAVTKEYKVNAWMLESNINGKGQAGATKPEHKIFNHAIRNTSEKITNTDVQGRSIGVLEAGQTFTYEGTIPVSKDSWNWENMGVLVIVSAQDAQGRWEIVNSAYCKVGESKPYEYWVEDVVE